VNDGSNKGSFSVVRDACSNPFFKYLLLEMEGVVSQTIWMHAAVQTKSGFLLACDSLLPIQAIRASGLEKPAAPALISIFWDLQGAS
jgi:hypothetical protein